MAPSCSYSSLILLLLPLATVVKEIASQESGVNSGVGGPQWDYHPNSAHGPGNWSKSYPHCGGQRQSPINIEVSQVTFDSLLTDFTFTDYDNAVLSEFELKNTGSSIQVSLPTDAATSISDGGLLGDYKLAQFHFHWGQTNEHGSEHLVDSKASSLEIHLVHWNKKYPGGFEEALNYTDGVVVLGVFVKVNTSSEFSASALGNLTNHFDQIPHPGNATTVSSFALKSLLPEHKNYYRYDGSLTTPACEETVTWTVFHDPIHLSEKEVEAFRSVHDSAGEKLLFNYRPPQALNGRVVKTSLPASATHLQSTTSAMVLATLCVVMATVSFI